MSRPFQVARYGEFMVGDPAVPRSGTGFEVVRRGYDQAQVEAHLRRLDTEVRILATDRDAATDQAAQLTRELDEARARTERLRAQVRTLVSPPQSVQGMSERMRSMLRLAEDEVAEMLGRAETEVNRRVRDAEHQATQVLATARAQAETVRAEAHADAERSLQEIAQARAAFEADRRAALDDIARSVADAERARSAAWAESQARIKAVEEDFTMAMDQRRSEALTAHTAAQLDARREIEKRRESAAAAARATVAEAQARARQIVADAERRVAELTALRRRVVEQLGGAHAVLDRTLSGLEPLPEEAATPAATTAEAPAAPAEGRGSGSPSGSTAPSAEPARSDSPSPHRRLDRSPAVRR